MTTAHTDGGIEHVGDGVYRLDLPDAAFATGAEHVDFGGTITGMVVIGGRVRLVDVDLEDTVRGGMTALPNAAADAAGGLVISDAGGLDIDAKLANTNEVTAARMGALTDWINGGRLDLIIDLILADTNELQSDDVPGLIAALNDISTAEVATELGTYDAPTNTEMAAAFTEIKGATWATTDSLEAIRDRGDAAWTTGAGGTPPQLLQSTTIATLATQVSFTLTAGSTDDDAYNGAVVVVTDQSTSAQKAVGTVSDYTGSTKTVTLASDPAIFTMATGDTIDVIANASSAPTAGANAIAVWDAVQSSHVIAGTFGEIATEVAACLADTDELQTDWTNAGRLDTILDSVLADTGELQVDWANGGRLDLIIDAILVDTAGLVITVGNSGDGLTSLASAADLSAHDSNLTVGVFNAITAIDTVVDSILVDTADLQANQGAWATATGFATSSALTTAQNDLDTITGSDGATLATTQGNYAPATAAAMASAQTDLDTLTAGVTCTAVSAAAVEDFWSTTTIAESYSAEGAIATPAELLYLIQQKIMQSSFVGTVQTVQKLDKATTAATFTVDSASTPTSIERTT